MTERRDDLIPSESSAEVARLQADIAIKRRRLAASLHNLRQGVADVADWRGWYEKNPGRYLGIAFVVGWLSAGILSPSSRRRW